MRIEDFNYYLPQNLIAQKPCPERDRSRLLIFYRKENKIEHQRFYQIIDFLQANDLLILNNTRVIPARLIGQKVPTGGKVEIFLLREREENIWECLLRPARRIKSSTVVTFSQGRLKATILDKKDGVQGLVKFESVYSIKGEIQRVGQVPLPPYIKRKEGVTSLDKKRYQTVYARKDGAIAAPTAGLHFTPELLKQIRQKGVKVAEITLHTGWASFKSLSQAQVEKNPLSAEYFKISREIVTLINRTKEEGGRIIAVGTTTTRALESGVNRRGSLKDSEGWSKLFIYPGYQFKMIDALVTNFHIPKSSLMLLVAAFMGKERLLSVYAEAVRLKYRFLSYGDAMLII